MNLADAQAHFAEVDPALHAATADLVPKDWPRRSPYEGLLRAIVGQQLSVKAAATIWARFVAHFDGVPEPEALLAASFEDLRGLGLSGRKVGYVQGVAEAARGGQLEGLDALDDATVRDRLVALKGVGVWTAEILLMSALRRPDVFPAGDLGLRRAMERLYQPDAEGKALEAWCAAYAVRWAPHRSAAARLLWAWLDNAPGVDPV